MNAELLYRHREAFHDGAILEVILWRVPQPVTGSPHCYKYRLFYGYPGQRLIAYDNERGKGDHRHFLGKEETYAFTTPEQLIEDFLAAVRRLRKIT
jgi:hypothetical protein